ncbi:MAG TPA: hexitol phosphatase HxpB [Steroidobacteraceae bacterium]
MFRAAIFDMDGLLIDSEGFWKRAERDVFGSVGIEINDEMAATTAPMTTRQVAEHWYGVRPWHERTIEDMEAAVISRVADQIRSTTAAMPGVHEILALCANLGWRVGLASNSPAVLCQLVLSQLGIASAFHAVVSADFVDEGKPHPAIYLHAARLLGVPPNECIAFEDSATGVRAARAAGMSVVAVPSAGQVFPVGPSAPHVLLNALHEFARDHAQELWAARG